MSNNKDLIHYVKDKEYTIVHNETNTNLNIVYIEDSFSAKYVGEFAIKANGAGWTTFPVSVFYTETPHPEGSNYFGIILEGNNSLICNAISVVEETWTGLLNKETNNVVYSAFGHDFQRLDGLFIDGGKDYIRATLTDNSEFVKLKIEKDKIIVIRDNISVDNEDKQCYITQTNEKGTQINEH